VARVGGDEGGVLDHALPHLQPLFVQLALQLLLHQPVGPSLSQTFPELPHCRVVGCVPREPQEVLEVDAVQHLPLQLRVAEDVPLLEHQQLHHQHLVGVGSASPWGVVGVHGFDDGSECFPVYPPFCLGEGVAVSGCFHVELPEEVGVKGVEGVHMMARVGVIYKSNRGGTKPEKQEVNQNSHFN